MKQLMIAVLCLFLLSVGAVAQDDVVEEVIVKINDEMISLSEFNRLYEPIVQSLEARFAGDATLEEKKMKYKRAAFNLLVNKKLLEVRFKELGFSFNDDVYQRAYSYFMERTQTKTVEELEQALAQNEMSLADVRKMAEESFVRDVVFNRDVVQQERPSESNIQEYYEKHAERYSTPEKVDISQIVISFTDSDKSIKKAVAEDAIQRIADGEDFDEVYRTVTPGVGVNATANIGEVESSSLRAELSEEVSSLNNGDVSQIVELDSVFVILKVNNKVPSTVMPLERIRQQVETDIVLELQEMGLDRLIKRYKREFFINVESESFKSLYDPQSTRRSLDRVL
jgi:peptidyl-prolyl cis-trans isomerase SurA